MSRYFHCQRVGDFLLGSKVFSAFFSFYEQIAYA
jgi:hypothetical protein